MVKTRVLCASLDLDSVVETLYDFGAIHVTRSKAFQPGRPLSKMELVSPMLVKLRTVESTLGLREKAGPKPFAGSLHDIRKEFDSLGLEKFDELARLKQKLDGEHNELSARRKDLAPFKSLAVEVGRLSARTSLLEFAVFELTGDRGKALGKAREYGEAVFFDGGKPKILVASDKRKAETLRVALAHYGREVAMPQAQESLSLEYSLAEEKLARVSSELLELRKRMDDFALRHGSKILALRSALEIE